MSPPHARIRGDARAADSARLAVASAFWDFQANDALRSMICFTFAAVDVEVSGYGSLAVARAVPLSYWIGAKQLYRELRHRHQPV
jgi:hypothetical protein